MERYTEEQRKQIVDIHYKYGKYFAETARKVRTFLGRNNAPSRTAIVKLIRKFESTGKVSDVKVATRARKARSCHNIVAVKESVAKNPDLSMGKRAQELGISRTSLRRILYEDIGVPKQDPLDSPTIESNKQKETTKKAKKKSISDIDRQPKVEKKNKSKFSREGESPPKKAKPEEASPGN